MNHFTQIAGRPVRRYSASDDLKHYKAPIRLRDFLSLRDCFWLCLIAVIIGWGLR